MRYRLRTLPILLAVLAALLSFGFWIRQRSMRVAAARMEMVIEQGYIDEHGAIQRKRQVIKNPFAVPAKTLPQKRPTRIQLATADIPYSKQFRMQAGDAYAVQLPDGKSVALWCEQPGPLGALFSDDSKSGLDIRWGEQPFKQPPLVRKNAGPDPNELVWKSYIVQGGVTTIGDSTREYELFVGNLRFSILEDLTAAGPLPVTISVTKK